VIERRCRLAGRLREPRTEHTVHEYATTDRRWRRGPMMAKPAACALCLVYRWAFLATVAALGLLWWIG
jgi:hypothetical protein